MTASFSGVNLKEREGLLSGVFRCCPKYVEGQFSFFVSLSLSLCLSPCMSLLFLSPSRRGEGGKRTTMSASLGLDDVREKARICGPAVLLAERADVRNTKGAILLAMMGDMLFNGQRQVPNIRRQ